jgi:hypothetical protein
VPTATIPANVERGAEFLDEKLPGWEEKINLRTLDLGSTCKCVVGQLYKEGPRDHAAYDRGLDVLGIPDGMTARLGFNTWGRQTFTRLTESWKDLIRQRRRRARSG